jgi:hypothetical protein
MRQIKGEKVGVAETKRMYNTARELWEHIFYVFDDARLPSLRWLDQRLSMKGRLFDWRQPVAKRKNEYMRSVLELLREFHNAYSEQAAPDLTLEMLRPIVEMAFTDCLNHGQEAYAHGFVERLAAIAHKIVCAEPEAITDQSIAEWMASEGQAVFNVTDANADHQFTNDELARCESSLVTDMAKTQAILIWIRREMKRRGIETVINKQ